MHPFRTQLGRGCGYAALALLLAAPALILYLPSAGSTLLYAMLLIALLDLAGAPAPDSAHHLARPARYWWPLAIAALISLAVVGVAQVVHGAWHASSIEKALRFACVVPVTLFFCRLDRTVLRHAQWGMMAGVLAGAHALIMPAAVIVSASGPDRPDTAAFTLYNTVGFANLVMLFTTITLACLGWTLTRFRRTEQAVKIVVALIGCYAVLLSQTRTSLLALPVFLCVLLLSQGHVSRRAKVMTAAAAVAVIALLSQSNIVQERVEQAQRETSECRNAPNTDSSICIRLQLLRAAGAMWTAHPVFGAGDGPQFRANMATLADRGVISPVVARNWGETHNDLAFVAATYGTVGLIAFLLLVYVAPTWYYIRRVRRADLLCKTAAVIGLLFVLEFAAFGLTEMMFRSMRTVSFYVVFTGLFLALSAPTREMDPK